MTLRSTNAARRRAAYLAVGDPDDYQPGHCVAWIESSDKVCGRPTTEYLCPMHVAVAARRADKEQAKLKARRDKERTQLLRDLPALIERRNRLAALRDKAAGIRRHDTDDLAAYGGIGIRQTPRQRAQYEGRVDKALAEYTRLDRLVRDLDRKIQRAQRLKEEA